MALFFPTFSCVSTLPTIFQNILKALLLMLLLTLRKLPALITHLIGARIPLKELPHIIKRGIRNIRKRLIGQKRLMRRHNHVRHGNQSGQNIIIHNMIRIIMEKYIRFFFIHVQAGCADLPLFNSFQQRLGINERSSRCVNQGKIYLPIIPYSSSVQSTQSLNRTPSSALQKSTQTS